MAFDDTATVSGSVVSINNGADEVPLKSCEVSLSPSLDGYSSVDVVQTGKNLVALNVSPQQAKRDFGITVNTQTADTLNVTTTGVAYACERLFYSFKKGTYAVKFLATSSDSFTPVISIYRTNGTGVKFNIQPNTLTTFTLADDADIDIRLFASGSGDTTLRTVEFSYFQIEVGSTVSTYSQYNSTVYTASLGRTIYGGEVDIVNGTGTDGYGIITFDGSNDENWQDYSSYNGFYIAISQMKVGTRQDGVSNYLTNSQTSAHTQDTYWLGVNSNRLFLIEVYNTMGNNITALRSYLSEHPLTVVYPLATPTDFTFDGQEINTRLGYNTMRSEQGNTELTYYKDGYGFTSVTVHKETPEGEPVEETRKLHRIIYEGQVDVINGTGLIYRGESGTQYDPPEQISFTPIEVSTDEGENTLYADQGDSAITYRKAVD